MVFQGLFAVRDPYLGFFNDSMMFSLNFRSLKKRVMDGRTDGRMVGRMDRKMDGLMDGRKDGWLDGWTERWTDGQNLL